MSNDREKFLLEMYKVFWDNISRAFDSAWKMLAAYAALFAGLSFVYEVFGAVFVLGILIPFSFVAVALALNSNLWFVRNLALVSNIEREFLYDDDFGKLLPERWKKPPSMEFFNYELWWLHIVVYLSVCLVTTAIMFPMVDYCVHKIGIAVLLTACSIVTFFYGLRQFRSFEWFKKAAPGRAPKKRVK